MWEGGVRSQTFLHWEGFSSDVKGTVWPGLAHATDWGVTLEYALLGETSSPNPGESPFDGINLWDALSSGGDSPRTEMLLSMRDVGECSSLYPSGCKYPGELAYRRGPYKLIYGHTALRGKQGETCKWSGGQLNCWNGWG